MTTRIALPVAAAVLAWSAGADADAAEKELTRSKGDYVQLFATALVGDGLRFNNPYRLATPLGSTAESVSRTASYADLGAAFTLGDPLGLQHGAALRLSLAMEGIGQTVLVPSYLMYRRWRAVAAYGRLGVAVVTRPESTWGGELAGGGVFFLRGGIGFAAEIVGDVFYGTGTRDVATATYPVLSGQAGLMIAWEALPR